MSRLALAVALLVACADPPKPVAPAPAPRPASTIPVELPTPTSEIVPVHADDPSLGPKTAPVTIVMWSDFQCPFCGRAESTMRALRERYGNELRVIWKDLPLSFHKFAHEAAVVARVVYLSHGNEAFWQVHDRLFENQAQLSNETIHGFANELGVDDATIESYRAEAESKVERGLAESKQLAIEGTPNFLVDGQLITGAQKIDKFAALIDTHLERARELLGKGVAPTEIYATQVKTYWKQSVPEVEVEEPLDPTVWKVEIGTSPTRGPKTAPITIVTFSDFECPFCKRLEPTLAQLEKDYPGKIRFVWKDHPLPFHLRATPAANAAREVRKQKGYDAFWKYHDALFAASRLEDDDLVAAAPDGVDSKKLLDAIKKNNYQGDLDTEADQADALKVSGTPHSFINGRAIIGALALPRWKRLIDDELAKPVRAYDDIIKGGKWFGAVDLKVPVDAPFRGGAKAKVVIQVFSDFQCPFCRRYARTLPDAPESGTLEKIEKKYGDKIRIVWRDYPLDFHNRARAAAAFAREARKQKGMATFWKIHDELFDLGGKLGDDELQDLAKRFGIDWAKAKAAIDKDTYKAQIDADVADGNAAGVSGTPVSFVNGKPFVGAQPADVLVKAIDRAFAKTK